MVNRGSKTISRWSNYLWSFDFSRSSLLFHRVSTLVDDSKQTYKSFQPDRLSMTPNVHHVCFTSAAISHKPVKFLHYFGDNHSGVHTSAQGTVIVYLLPRRRGTQDKVIGSSYFPLEADTEQEEKQRQCCACTLHFVAMAKFCVMGVSCFHISFFI